MSENFSGTEGGCCTTAQCQYSRVKPRAEFWNSLSGRWVCMTCAQKENRRYLSVKPCISGRDRLMQILRS
jgi:hypothetical protein